VTIPPFGPVREKEQARAISTIVSAFTEDPVERWMYPGEEQYLTHFPEFVAAYGGDAVRGGTVWRLGDCEAVAFWLAPGVQPDGDAIVAVLRESVPAAKHDTLFSVLGQMDDAHPAYPHWYLPWLGVAVGSQGEGLGGELLRRCLALVDSDHLPAYLETPNPRTIPFYESHDFEVIGEATAGDCPPITLMLRQAR
jgi:ribosomal protein S18 acetylase RimI-like enzyme